MATFSEALCVLFSSQLLSAEDKSFLFVTHLDFSVPFNTLECSFLLENEGVSKLGGTKNLQTPQKEKPSCCETHWTNIHPWYKMYKPLKKNSLAGVHVFDLSFERGANPVLKQTKEIF